MDENSEGLYYYLGDQYYRWSVGNVDPIDPKPLSSLWPNSPESIKQELDRVYYAFLWSDRKTYLVRDNVFYIFDYGLSKVGTGNDSSILCQSRKCYGIIGNDFNVRSLTNLQCFLNHDVQFTSLVSFCQG